MLTKQQHISINALQIHLFFFVTQDNKINNSVLSTLRRKRRYPKGQLVCYDLDLGFVFLLGSGFGFVSSFKPAI